MNKKAVKCAECGKILLYTDETCEGKIAHEIMRKKYIAKLPVLYGCTDWVFVCNKECWKKWRDKNISKEKIEEGEKAYKNMREKMMSEDFQRGLRDGLNRLCNAYRKNLASRQLLYRKNHI